MMVSPFVALLTFVAIIAAPAAMAGMPIDPQATPETVALFQNLKRLSADHVLFGHQHATEYGHGWSGDADRSDVKSVTGSHPAVIGLDFQSLSGCPEDESAASEISLRKHIVATYDRGGVVTVSWHFNNPVTPETGFRWTDGVTAAAVAEIIPGGSHHDVYKEILRRISRIAHSVRGADGALAPIIFRPYHEFDGGWFWWGKTHASRDDFITLWRFTVEYLRDKLGVHNFLYAFSPDVRFSSEPEYLERYPGDEYVDLVGCDDYAGFGRNGKYDLDGSLRRLRIVSDYARRAGKLAALTETGLEGIPNETWWTDVLLKTLRHDGVQVAYVLVWRNDTRSPTHYYAPFPGHPSAPDFVRFHEDPFTLFENDLQPRLLYRTEEVSSPASVFVE